MEQMLTDVVIFLAAALIAVPLSIRLGFGSVLGYLLAGVAIGPWVTLVVTLSMVTTPLLLLMHQRLWIPRFRADLDA